MEKLVRKIGLVAHDAMKKDLIEWVLWNSELLMGHKFYCTGTTGTLILAALKEKHPDVEWDFTILKSGPLGGDQQMGSRIVDGEIDYLFFFTDPMTLQPHDTDVKASLIRLMNVLFPIIATMPRGSRTSKSLPRRLNRLRKERRSNNSFCAYNEAGMSEVPVQGCFCFK